MPVIDVEVPRGTVAVSDAYFGLICLRAITETFRVGAWMFDADHPIMSS